MNKRLPRDLGLKIGSEEQAFYEQVKKSMLEEVKRCRQTILLNERLIPELDALVSEEKQKFKKKKN